MDGILGNVQGTEGSAADQQQKNTATEQQEKTFTQAEVNDIVEKRLARERKRFSMIQAGRDPRELELDERERAVQVKEMQIDARVMLEELGIQPEALGLLNYEDDEKLRESVELLKDVVSKARLKGVESLMKGGKPLKRAPENDDNIDMRAAFGLRR